MYACVLGSRGSTMEVQRLQGAGLGDVTLETFNMGIKAAINGYTAWSNVRLVKGGCQPAENILRDIMRGRQMKILLER